MKIRNFAFCLLPFALSGCMTDAKLAQRCADRFPCDTLTTVQTIIKDTLCIDTLYLPSESVLVMDTTICPDSSVIIHNLPCVCPPQEVITKIETIEKEKVIVKIDSAKFFIKQREIDLLKTQIDILKSANMRKNWLLIGVAIAELLAILWLWFFKK